MDPVDSRKSPKNVSAWPDWQNKNIWNKISGKQAIEVKIYHTYEMWNTDKTVGSRKYFLKTTTYYETYIKSSQNF